MQFLDSAAYFSMMPLVAAITEPYFKHIVLENGCKEPKKLAARSAIREGLAFLTSPLLVTVAYNYFTIISKKAPLEFTQVLSGPYNMLMINAFMRGVNQIQEEVGQVFITAYGLENVLPKEATAAKTKIENPEKVDEKETVKTDKASGQEPPLAPVTIKNEAAKSDQVPAASENPKSKATDGIKLTNDPSFLPQMDQLTGATVSALQPPLKLSPGVQKL